MSDNNVKDVSSIELNSVIKMTPSAIEYITNLMRKRDNAIGFLLGVKESGCSGYRYAPQVITELPDEKLISGEFDGLIVYLPQRCVEWVRGLEIDCVEKVLKQKMIVYRNPRAEDVCGCGESFNVKPVGDDDK